MNLVEWAVTTRIASNDENAKSLALQLLKGTAAAVENDRVPLRFLHSGAHVVACSAREARVARRSLLLAPLWLLMALDIR